MEYVLPRSSATTGMLLRGHLPARPTPPTAEMAQAVKHVPRSIEATQTGPLRGLHREPTWVEEMRSKLAAARVACPDGRYVTAAPSQTVASTALEGLRRTAERGLKPYRLAIGADGTVELWYRQFDNAREPGRRAELTFTDTSELVLMRTSAGDDDEVFDDARADGPGIARMLDLIATHLGQQPCWEPRSRSEQAVHEGD